MKGNAYICVYVCFYDEDRIVGKNQIFWYWGVQIFGEDDDESSSVSGNDDE